MITRITGEHGVIPMYAQKGNYDITSVVIEEGVRRIEYGAFAQCIGLKEIVFPSTLEYIGEGAFEGCHSLTEIVIPDSVTSIRGGAFSDCCDLQSVVIGKNITRIPSLAFSYCFSLSSVTLPDSLTSIGNSAFSDCKELMTINFPDGLECIDEGAFLNCYKLPSVILPESIKEIGRDAFGYCLGLTSVTILGEDTVIGYRAFLGCAHLESVVLPKNLHKIADHVFYDCVSLSKINIPDSVQYFGEGCFCWMPLKSAPKNYKAFKVTPKGELMCRDKKYTLGKKSFVKGELELCVNGIHYCTNLFDIFNYYNGTYGDFVIAECEVSEEQKSLYNPSDSKKCARWIIPQRLLSKEEVINILNGGK